MTVPETAASDPASDARAERPADALRSERVPLPALDALALLEAVPESRPALLWRAPGEDARLGVGRALRVAPGGRGLEGFAAAIASALAAATGGAAADGSWPEPLRVFFSVGFDPASREHAFGTPAVPEPSPPPSPGAADWRGYSPVEAWVPEILVRCGADGSEALLAGTGERLAVLRAELDDLVAESLRAAGAGAASVETPAEAPGGRPRRAREAVANLVIEWAERDYRAQVVAALDALGRPPEGSGPPAEDRLTKVVLSHAVEVRPDRPFVPAAILRELRRDHPGCFLFAVRPAPGAAVFLGASPERLARVEAGGGAAARRVVSGALAGSAPRGRDRQEDEALGRRLLGSAKDREEHEIVGDMIAAALEPLCRRVDRRPAPVLEKLATVQHLFTPISGELHPGRGVLDAVAALHPTPAVGGMPRRPALEAIRRLERHPRGLYAGVVGWAAADGTGDSAVAIRSALVGPGAGESASVFAGGGIVPTSDPDVEVAETRLKLAAVLGAMERAGAAARPEAEPEAGRGAEPVPERERWTKAGT